MVDRLSSDVLYIYKNCFVTANWILHLTANVFPYLRVAVTYHSFEGNWIFHFVSVSLYSVVKRDICRRELSHTPDPADDSMQILVTGKQTLQFVSVVRIEMFISSPISFRFHFNWYCKKIFIMKAQTIAAGLDNSQYNFVGFCSQPLRRMCLNTFDWRKRVFFLRQKMYGHACRLLETWSELLQVWLKRWA